MMHELRLRTWQDLSPRQQVELREAYGRYLDSLPPTCDLEIKVERFRQWLGERGVSYSPDR